jgi:PAS domain S-box-containing protein
MIHTTSGNEESAAQEGPEIIQDRRTLARIAGLAGTPPSRLFRLLANGRIVEMGPSGNHPWLSLEGPRGLDGLLTWASERCPGYRAVSLEMAPGRSWGLWLVPKEAALDVEATTRALAVAVQLLERTEEWQRLAHTSDSLWTLLGLGHTLSAAEDPGAMATAVHEAATRIFGPVSSALALFSQDSGRSFRLARDAQLLSQPARPADWQALFKERTCAWHAESPLASASAALLGLDPSSGLCERVGDGPSPLGYLLILRPSGPFSEREQGLVSRMADFLFAALMRRENRRGTRSRAVQSADLFVLLAQERERLDYVLRSVPVGILLTDLEGGIELANDTAGRALGLTDVEMREKKIFGSRPAGRALLGLIEKARSEGKPISTPYEMEGRWFHVQVIPWPGGAQFLVVTQDIQDWFQLNRLKEDLISIISHEVKNPLTAIINAASLLSTQRPGPLTEPQQRLSDLVAENSQKIRDLLDDVVRLSRVHQMGSEQERVDLRALLQRLRANYRDTIQGKLLVWKEELQNLAVVGDPRMLENLFTNLLGNAIKYSAIGGCVGVRLGREDDWVRVRVVDDGPGIPAAERDRLFKPFFRASNVRGQVSGTGLGLVIAKNIAERLGGRLSVESPLPPEEAEFLGSPKGNEHGTVFRVDLPAQD